MARSCIIIGGGIAGATAALTFSDLGIQCSIYEVRDQPATIGGSVNLTPSALRLLENIGVRLAHGCVVDAIEVFSLRTGSKLGELPFRKSGHALRIMRENLQEALLEAVKVAGIVVQYGSKLSSVEDVADSPKITAVFSNGNRAEAVFIMGCDGVHSVVRTSYVEPGRCSTFSGVAAAYAVVDADGVPPLHFQTTAATSRRFGTLLTSFIEEDRKKIFLTATMTAIEKKDKWEWKTRGEDTKATMEEVRRRYQDSVLPCIMPLVDKVDEFVFCPVYTLGSGGIWSKGRVLLLGDAAHCVS
jgi:salicylate hydroxylase